MNNKITVKPQKPADPASRRGAVGSFFSGVLVLTAANIIVKAIGLLYKIPLLYYLDDLGMGYFNAAYTIYTWFYMVTTAGLPVAVSILTSESRARGDTARVKRIYRTALCVFSILGLAGMAAMFFGSGVFASLMKNDNSVYCIMAIAPTLFFVCIWGAMRGYFQGYQRMGPIAVSQVLEALGKLVIGILMAVWASAQGFELHVIAAYAVLGVMIGAAAGMLYLFVSKLIFGRTAGRDDSAAATESDTNPVFGKLLKIAVPITISSSVMSLVNVIDMMIVTRRLQDIFIEKSAAVAMYGNYTTLAVPLFNLPPVLVYPIAFAIVPVLTSSLASGAAERVKLMVNSSVRIASVIAVPCTLGLSVFSRQILGLIFRNKHDSVEMAAPLLSVLALSTFFVCMLSVTNSILQAYKQEKKPIISMLAGAAVKLAASYILIGIPGVGMLGAPIGTFLCYLTATAFNFYYIMRYVGILPNVKNVYLKPFAASVLCIAGALGIEFLLLKIIDSRSIVTLLTIAAAALIYVFSLLLIGGVSEEDIMLLPGGAKILRILVKLRLMKRGNAEILRFCHVK